MKVQKIGDVRSAQILCDLKWKASFADRRQRQMKSLLFKRENNLAPEYLSENCQPKCCPQTISGAPNMIRLFQMGQTLRP